MKAWESRITKFRGLEVGSRNNALTNIRFRVRDKFFKKYYDRQNRYNLAWIGEVYRAGAYKAYPDGNFLDYKKLAQANNFYNNEILRKIFA